MLKRILILSGLVALTGGNAIAAKFPFGRRTTRSTPVRNPNANHMLGNILKDPAKMTERFGPSILVRENKSTSFVSQPE